DAFAVDRSIPDGRHTKCRACVAKYMAKYDAARRADPEVRRREAQYMAARRADPEYREREAEYHRVWRAANLDRHRANEQRRRARKAQATVEQFTSADLAAHYEELSAYDCSVCGLPMTTPDDNT